jgi:hypothetical protein
MYFFDFLKKNYIISENNIIIVKFAMVFLQLYTKKKQTQNEK